MQAHYAVWERKMWPRVSCLRFLPSSLKSLWKTGFSTSVENAIRILIGFAPNPKMVLGITDIFNNIDPSNLWTWDIFSFVCVFFNFFHQSLVVFIIQIFHFLVYTYSYFIVFDGIVNGKDLKGVILSKISQRKINIANMWNLKGLNS